MRVNIETKQVQQGWLSKTTLYEVHTTVQFTEEEQHIIKTNDLTRTVVMERDCPPDKKPLKGYPDLYDLTVSKLLDGNPNVYALRTPAEAKAYTAHMTEQLKRLKEFLDENAEVEEKSTSFDL